ncbi:MAG: lipoyl synthase [Gammaproteobacteria bacterium]|jgi:lipoic acid synthetase|nr:lipoyl synthase [Gammaproteobacteria bacterium]|tara:strand:+ start:4738 stop:5718 length:981 start_codon:yes stop_codon:yes gene_type:complete
MEIIPTSKIINRDGIKAIKNGQKLNKFSNIPTPKKPNWLKVKAEFNPNFHKVKEQVQSKQLYTVCEEAHCPNISECWSAGTATFMLMGSVCTRSCKFCSVDTGNPNGWLDKNEPFNTAKAVEIMKLKYVVLTSVNRDDLPDGGAQHFADTVKLIKKLNPNTAVEALTPDFKGLSSSIDTLVNCGLEVFAQNIETVERLTHQVRDIRAGYQQTLDVLLESKRINPKVLTKSSIILGLGEEDSEIEQTMDDLVKNKVDILTIGQYLRPTINHHPIERWVSPEEFEKYRLIGLRKGFLEVVSGPMVRSSYRAERALEKNNAGLKAQSKN